MRMYYSMFKIRFVRGLQYRAAALAGVGTQFFFGMMYIMIFTAFYGSSDVVQPVSLEQQVQFVWLRQAMLALFVMWYKDAEIIDSIMNGDVAYELCRPTRIYNLWFAKIQGRRLAGACLRSFPILVIAFLLPGPYNLILPTDVWRIVLFILTLVLGSLLSTGIMILIYTTVFHTLSPAGSIMIFSTIDEFLSGGIIPIPLMPEAIKNITYILPFRYTFDLPFRIFSGNIGMTEALISIPIQIIWFIVIIFLGKLFMRKSMKKIVIQGG